MGDTNEEIKQVHISFLLPLIYIRHLVVAISEQRVLHVRAETMQSGKQNVEKTEGKKKGWSL